MSQAKVLNLAHRRWQKRQIMEFWEEVKAGSLTNDKIAAGVNELYEKTGKTLIYTFLRMLPSLEEKEQFLAIYCLSQLPPEGEIIDILLLAYRESQSLEMEAQIIALLISLGVDISQLERDESRVKEILDILKEKLSRQMTWAGQTRSSFPLNKAGLGDFPTKKQSFQNNFYLATASITREENFVALALSWEQKDGLVQGACFILDFSCDSPSCGIADFWVFHPLTKEQFHQTFLMNNNYLDPEIQLTTISYQEAVSLIQSAFQLKPENIPPDPYWKKFAWLLDENLDLDEQKYRQLTLNLVAFPKGPEGMLQVFHHAWATDDRSLVYACLASRHPWRQQGWREFYLDFDRKKPLLSLEDEDFHFSLNCFMKDLAEEKKEAYCIFRVQREMRNAVFYGKFHTVKEDGLWLLESGDPTNLTSQAFHRQVARIVLQTEGLIGKDPEQLIARANELVRTFDYPPVPYILKAALRKLPARDPQVLPAMLQLATAEIRLGNQEGAAEVLHKLEKTSNPIYASWANRLLQAMQFNGINQESLINFTTEDTVECFLLQIFDRFDLPKDQCIYALTLWGALPRFVPEPINDKDLKTLAAAIIYNAYRLDQGRKLPRHTPLGEYLAQMAGDWSKLQIKANNIWNALSGLGQDPFWIIEEANVLFAGSEDSSPY
ncbi:MAG: tetratricopeptide repeat protein [Bacillota bacterium]|jgi:hypothetical protein